MVYCLLIHYHWLVSSNLSNTQAYASQPTAAKLKNPPTIISAISLFHWDNRYMQPAKSGGANPRCQVVMTTAPPPRGASPPPPALYRSRRLPPPHTPNQITGARVPTSVRPTLATLTQSTLYWRNSILILFTRFWLRLVCEVRDADGRWFVGCRPFASRCYDCMHPLCSLQAAILVVLSFAYFLLTFQPARFGFRSFLSQVQ